MKKIKFLLVALLVTGFSNAQSDSEDIDMVQAAFGQQKKELISQNMDIPQSQKDAFWTTYDEYETERKSNGKEVLTLIKDYANSYTNLTDEQAKDLMKRKFSLNADQIKLQKKYFDKFSKIIGAKQSAKFFQMEDYLLNITKLAIQNQIPFVGELNNMKK